MAEGTRHVILRVIDNLTTLVAPVLPHVWVKAQVAQKIVSTACGEYLGYEGQLFGALSVETYEEETKSHEALTYDHGGAVGTWATSGLPGGAGTAGAGAVVQEVR